MKIFALTVALLGGLLFVSPLQADEIDDILTENGMTDLVDDVKPQKSHFLGNKGFGGGWLGGTHFFNERNLDAKEQFNFGGFYFWRWPETRFHIGGSFWTNPLELKLNSSTRASQNGNRALDVQSKYAQKGRQMVLEMNGALSANIRAMNIFVGGGLSFHHVGGEADASGTVRLINTDTGETLVEKQCSSSNKSTSQTVLGEQIFVGWEYLLGDRAPDSSQWGLFFLWKHQLVSKIENDAIALSSCRVTEFSSQAYATLLDDIKAEVSSEMDLSNQNAVFGVAYHF